MVERFGRGGEGGGAKKGAHDGVEEAGREGRSMARIGREGCVGRGLSLGVTLRST